MATYFFKSKGRHLAPVIETERRAFTIRIGDDSVRITRGYYKLLHWILERRIEAMEKNDKYLDLIY